MTSKATHHERIVLALRTLKKNRFDVTNEAPGVCGIVNALLTEMGHPDTRMYWRDVRDEAWKDWPHYSGHLYYPLKPITSDNPAQAYWFEPRWEGQMGAMRWDLVEHLIAKFSEPVGEPNELDLDSVRWVLAS